MNHDCFVSGCFVSESYTTRHQLGYDHGLIWVVFLLNMWRLALQITFDFRVSTDRIRLLLMRQHSFGMVSFCSCVLLWIRNVNLIQWRHSNPGISNTNLKTESCRLETNPAVWNNSTWPYFEKRITELLYDIWQEVVGPSIKEDHTWSVFYLTTKGFTLAQNPNKASIFTNKRHRSPVVSVQSWCCWCIWQTLNRRCTGSTAIKNNLVFFTLTLMEQVLDFYVTLTLSTLLQHIYLCQPSLAAVPL